MVGKKNQEMFEIQTENKWAFVLCPGSRCEMNIGVKTHPLPPLARLFTFISSLCHSATRVTEPQEESPGSQLHPRKNSITVAL